MIFGAFLAATIFRNFGVARRNNAVDFIKAPMVVFSWELNSGYCI